MSQPSLRLFIVALVTLTITGGCKSPSSDPSLTASAAGGSASLRNGTYSLLYELLSKVRNVDKLLIVKNERNSVGELVVEIAQTAADASEDMEEWAKDDPGLKLKQKILPEAEVKARETIGSKRGKQLLFATGEKFELNLLLSQAEALSYGAQLAQLASTQDTSLSRRLRMEELSRKLERLHEQVLGLLGVRGS